MHKTMASTPQQLIKGSHLQPHPEGGYFSETWRSKLQVNLSGPDGRSIHRSAGTSIQFLLSSESPVSRLHWLDSSDESWHYYCGNDDIIVLYIEEKQLQTVQLGQQCGKFQLAAIPAGTVFGAMLHSKWIELTSNTPEETEASTEATSAVESAPAEPRYALMGCDCAPGFEFADFHLASWGNVAHLRDTVPASLLTAIVANGK